MDLNDHTQCCLRKSQALQSGQRRCKRQGVQDPQASMQPGGGVCVYPSMERPRISVMLWQVLPVGGKEDIAKEKDHIRGELASNGYPRKFIAEIAKKQRKR